jgi:hypothetical protein
MKPRATFALAGTILFIQCLLITSVGKAFAAVDSLSYLAQKGRLLLQDDFKQPAVYTKEYQQVAPGWMVKAWHQEFIHLPQGGIESKWTTGHNPVLAYECHVKDVVVEVEFKFEKDALPANNGYLRVNFLNRELFPKAYSVSTFVNGGTKGRPLGLTLENEQWRSQGYVAVQSRYTEIKPETWYKVRLEVIGDYAVLTCNGTSVSGSNPTFALPKTMFTLAVGKIKHQLRNLRIYEATPNPAFIKPKASDVPYVAVADLPSPGKLDSAKLTYINNLTPIFDGKTLNGWIQAPVAPIGFGKEDIVNYEDFAKRLTQGNDKLSKYLYSKLDSTALLALSAAVNHTKEFRQTFWPFIRGLNKVIAATPIYSKELFKGVPLSPTTQALLNKKPSGENLGRLNRLLLEDAYPALIKKSPDSSWEVRDGVLASKGAGRGVIYTAKDYENYRLVLKVRQRSGDHNPGILVFCQRPPVGELGLDALGGIQLTPTNGSHWDYRPGINRSGDHFTRIQKIKYDISDWVQVEILVNGKTGKARLALAPVGYRASEVTVFSDPTIAGKLGPIALQMHNGLLFDEYKDIRIEIDPKEDKLITID